MADDRLAELFSSKVRAAVLGYLLPRPHLAASLTELSRLLDLPISSLQHECYKLVRLGVLRDRRAGNARRYRPDPTSPLLPALTALVVATIGREAALRAAVAGMPELERAFLAGDLGPGGDPRLVLVGELPLDALDTAVERIAVALGRDPTAIDLAFFRPADWRTRVATGNPFAADLLGGPCLALLEATDAPADGSVAPDRTPSRDL